MQTVKGSWRDQRPKAQQIYIYIYLNRHISHGPQNSPRSQKASYHIWAPRSDIYIVGNKSGTEQVYDQTGRIEGFFLKSSHRQPDMMTEQSASKTTIRGRSMYNQTIQAYTPTNQNAIAHSLTHSLYTDRASSSVANTTIWYGMV